MPRTKTTVQPYSPGTNWTFSYKGNGFAFTEELVLLPEPSGSPISDDYTRDEISAHDLWRMWADKTADHFHKQWPDLYRPGEVHINWFVTKPTVTGIFEGAPFVVDSRTLPGLPCAGGPREDFLTHYTDPVNADTGEPLNWMRLPVLDLGWNSTDGNKGGFIQEATGWKPSPLQPTMNVVQIGRAAGIYVPDLL
ncbi:hypothetical protein [Streptomyces sp. NPDC051561]|uniref:hypothetical protein n=1 Tax=Streptomyces sp. NPDC051561 TaxID=3365658 RepID=UPI00378A2C2C